MTRERHTVVLPGAELALVLHLPDEPGPVPCIVALRLHATRASVVAEMERRLGNNADAELAAALEQIGHITRGRLAKLLGED